MTESAAIASAAQKDTLKELGVEQYEILATLDGKTSEICRDMDGKVFDMKDYEVGVTAPPFHPNCRSTTVPHFDDEFTDGEERAARNEVTGETYYVPANMKYREWEKKFVEDYDSFHGNNTKKESKGIPKKIAELDENHYNAIGERIGKAPDYIRTLIEDHYDEIKYSDSTDIKYGVFRRKSGVIDINFENDAQNPFGSYTVAFHEMGHCIDKQMGNVSERIPGFAKILKEDTDRFIQEAKKIYQTDDICDTISKELKQYYPGQSVADLLGATTGNEISVAGWQHNPDYWKKPSKLEHEAFAHFFEATARCDEDKLEMIQTVFPNAYEAFINAVKVR